MLRRLRSPLLHFALSVSFGLPTAIVAAAEAQPSTQKLSPYWTARPQKPDSKPCYICAQPTPSPVPKTIAPLLFKNVEKPPSKPLIVTASTKEWEDFWGLYQKSQTVQQRPRPAIRYLTWRNYRTAYTRENIDKLNKASMTAVEKPREVTRGRGKRRHKVTIRGNVSKQLCYRAVKETLLNAGIVKDYIPGEAAIGAATYMKAQKYPNGQPMFVDIGPRVSNDPNEAPPGSIIVYRGGSWGHIELKIKDQYCSDHCNAIPMNEKISRYVVGIFLPIASELP